MMDTPNRAQRRAAARATKGRSKPRSQHRRTVVTNPITYAQEGANLVPRHKRDAITNATRAALRAVRNPHHRHRQHGAKAAQRHHHSPHGGLT